MLNSYSRVPATNSYTSPAYYEATFSLKKTGDTWLDMSTWGKGLVWVNGHCLGRYWNVGPQQALFLPGCWLKKGNNRIVVLDISGPEVLTTRGLSHPIVDILHKEKMPQDAYKVKNSQKRKSHISSGNQGNDAAPGAK